MPKLKDFELLFIYMALFGFIILIANSEEFSNFPREFGVYGFVGLLLLMAGIHFVWRIETSSEV